MNFTFNKVGWQKQKIKIPKGTHLSLGKEPEKQILPAGWRERIIKYGGFSTDNLPARSAVSYHSSTVAVTQPGLAWGCVYPVLRTERSR